MVEHVVRTVKLSPAVDAILRHAAERDRCSINDFLIHLLMQTIDLPPESRAGKILRQIDYVVRTITLTSQADNKLSRLASKHKLSINEYIAKALTFAANSIKIQKKGMQSSNSTDHSIANQLIIKAGSYVQVPSDNKRLKVSDKQRPSTSKRASATDKKKRGFSA